MKSKLFIPVTPSGRNRNQLRQAFQDKTRDFILKAGLTGLYKKGDRLKAVITFHYVHPSNHKDLDNSIKPLLDTMKGIIFPDDSQIWDLHLRKVCPSDKLGVEFRIFKIRWKEKESGSK